MSISKIIKMIKVKTGKQTRHIAEDLNCSESIVSQWISETRDPSFKLAISILRLAIKSNVEVTINDLIDI
jgi:hypothetical protein